MPDDFFNNNYLNAPEEDVNAKVERLTNEGYSFSISQCYSDSFRIFSKYSGLFVGFTLLFIVAIFVPTLFAKIQVLPSIISSFINPALLAGLALTVRKIMKDEGVIFNDFFSGFAFLKMLFIRSIVTTIVISGISALIFYYIFGDFSIMNKNPQDIVDLLLQKKDEVNFALVFFLFLPIIYLGVAWYFADFFIVFHNKSFWEAMEMSRRLITKKWFLIFLFVLSVVVVNALGLLVFLVGFLFTFPLTMIATVVLFNNIVENQ
ncbi:MAG: hypothetical protein IPO21_18805 [Bacteroidales bacterium]|nr:hypothetical protein [Bacteroidales bacterium]